MRVNDIKEILRRYHIAPFKSRGQHFLVDEQAIDKVIHSVNPQKYDTIVEIGPGLGALTRHLAPNVAKLIAIEIDKGFGHILKDSLGLLPSFELVQGDILTVPLPNITGYKIVGNLPYNIAPHILERFLCVRVNRPSLAVVTVQKEFAQRLVAPQGSLNRIGLFTQYHGNPSIVAHFSPGSFWPQPKVYSSLVVIPLRPPEELPLSPEQETRLWALVRRAFGQPRKKMKNSLPLCPALLQEKRPNELSLEEWIQLASLL